MNVMSDWIVWRSWFLCPLERSRLVPIESSLSPAEEFLTNFWFSPWDLGWGFCCCSPDSFEGTTSWTITRRDGCSWSSRNSMLDELKHTWGNCVGRVQDSTTPKWFKVSPTLIDSYATSSHQVFGTSMDHPHLSRFHYIFFYVT